MVKRGNALRKEFFMEIKKTYTRFLSICLIVALGTAFFAGVRAANPDMHRSADAFFDESRLMDIRVLSTLGLTDEDVDAIRAIDGIELAQPAYSQDVLTMAGEQQIVLKLMSVTDQVNLVTVDEGRLPENEGECLVDNLLCNNRGFKIGDQLTLISGDQTDIEDIVEEQTVTITGRGRIASYLNLTRDSSQIGDGSVSGFVMLTPDSFKQEAYTEIDVRVRDAAAMDCYGDEYAEKIDGIVDQIEEIADARCQIRYDDVVAEAEEKIADAKQEVADGEKELDDAAKEIEDGERQLADAKQEVADGDREIADAEREVVDGRRELEDARTEVENNEKKLADSKSQLADGERELNDAKAQVMDSERQLEAAKQKTADGERQLEEAKQEAADGERQLAEAKQKAAESAAQLEASRKEIEENEAYLQAQEQTYSDQKAQLEDARTQLEASRPQIEALRAQLPDLQAAIENLQQRPEGHEAELAQLEAQLEAAANAIAEFDAKEQELVAGETALAAGRSELDDGWTQLAAGKEQLAAGEAAYEAGMEEIAANEAALAAGREEIAASEAQLADAREQLADSEAKIADAHRQISDNEAKLADAREEIADGERQLADARGQIADNEAKLADAEREIEENRQKLSDARKEIQDSEKELADGKKEYDDALTENTPKLEDARADIAEAEADIADLEVPEWYVLDRDYIQTCVEYAQDAERIGNIGNVFPFIFFLVAALVSLTTMTRMVEEERTQIGTLKALGYGKASIAAKYVLYAFFATMIGGIFGTLIGQKLLPMVIMRAYSILYVTITDYLTPLHPGYTITSLLAAIVSTTVAVIAACYRELMSAPAQLMRPEAPKAGKRVWLEHITPIWRRLKFSSKAAVRNLFRYKKRLWMTVIGIGGCMGLLLVGFGLKDSIMTIGDRQYSAIRIYDSTLTFGDDSSDAQRAEVFQDVAGEANTDEAMMASESTVDFSSDAAGKGERSGYLFVPSELERMDDFIVLQNRLTKERYRLSDDGAVISEKLATLLSVDIGDEIYIETEEMKRVPVKVTGIAENYYFHYVYLTPALYEKVFEEPVEFKEIFVKFKEPSQDYERVFSGKYLQYDSVSGISYSRNMSERISNLIRSMDAIIYVIIVSAGLLAFVVLYNLNNINISERKRELATLKVLGFFDGEVSIYVFRENVWLTIFGAITGVFFGIALHRFVILTAEIDLMMFGRQIYPRSFIYSILLTFAFSFAVNLVMHRKLKKIDMIESLKSVE